MSFAHTRKNHYKKTSSVAAVEIKPGDLALGTPKVGVILPARAIVTSLTFLTEAAHNGGAITVESLDSTGATDAKIDLTNATPAVGVSENLLSAPEYTETGMQLQFSTAALMTSGCVQVVIEYVEPTLSTGKLTNVD